VLLLWPLVLIAVHAMKTPTPNANVSVNAAFFILSLWLTVHGRPAEFLTLDFALSFYIEVIYPSSKRLGRGISLEKTLGNSRHCSGILSRLMVIAGG